MAKLSILAGATSQTINIFIADSSSTTGAGLTGLAYNTSNLVAYYALPKAAAVQISLATLAAITTAYSSGGFKEVDATNMPGWYRLDLPDAAIASGRFVAVHLKGATNMAPLPLEIELTAVNNQSATSFITGVNALAPPTNWNLHSIDSNGRVDVIKVAGTTQTARDLGASVLLSSGTGTGQLDFTSGVVKANAVQWLGGTIPAVNVTGVPLVDAKYLLGTIFSTPTVAGIPNVNAKTWNDLATVALPLIPTTAGRTLDVSAGGEAGVDWANVGSPTTTVGLSGTTVKEVTDVETKLGTPAGASVSADIATANTKLDTIDDFVDTEVAAIKAKTDNLPSSPAAVGSAMALTSGERNSVADALLDRSAGVETGITPRQALRVALAALAGKLSGAATTTVAIRDTNDGVNRITATVDANGNRSAVTLDLT